MSLLRCRLLGHRWDFFTERRDVVWSCLRCADAGGRRTYPDARQARYHAAYFNRARPKPPTPFIAPMAGVMARRDDLR